MNDGENCAKMKCKAVLKTGNRKGEACGKPSIHGDYCGVHNPDKKTSSGEKQPSRPTNRGTSYILQDISIPSGISRESIIEPFCGEGDLLGYFRLDMNSLECWDIEPKSEPIKKRNAILDPPDYTGTVSYTHLTLPTIYSV